MNPSTTTLTNAGSGKGGGKACHRALPKEVGRENRLRTEDRQPERVAEDDDCRGLISAKVEAFLLELVDICFGEEPIKDSALAAGLDAKSVVAANLRVVMEDG